MLRLMLILFLFLSSSFAKKLRKIKLQLQWKHQFEFAGFYAAKEKGFYKDIGLDVEFLEFKKEDDIVKNVLKQKAEFGTTYSSIIAEYLNDKPILMLANYFKQSPLVLITQKEIKNLKTLKGKKVMGVSDNIDSITLNLMLKSFGVSLNEIENIPTSFNIQDFVDKKVDAMAVFSTNEIYDLDKLGVKYNLFNPSVYSYEYYDLNLFTSKEFAKKNSSLVRKFKEASTKGWKYAIENKEELVDIILEKYNTQNKTKESLLFEANQIKHLMLSRVEEIGSIDIKRVELIAKNFIEAEFAKEKNLKDISNIVFEYEKQLKIGELNLSSEEKRYLQNKEYITFCVDPNWEPYEKIVDGEYEGLVSGFIDLIKKK